jgi:hypothetical protein
MQLRLRPEGLNLLEDSVCPNGASNAAKLTATVVFPAPPLCAATTMVLTNLRMRNCNEVSQPVQVNEY